MSLNPNILYYQKRILTKAGIKSISQQALLDVGCGEGEICKLFSKKAREVIGIDIIPNPNWKKVKKENIHFLVADACNIPLF